MTVTRPTEAEHGASELHEVERLTTVLSAEWLEQNAVLPLRMVANCASLIKRGAGLPGIRAVVMTMSCLAMCAETNSACAATYSSLISPA